LSDQERAVITVLGEDRVGIVSGISQILAENKVNILDLTSSKIQDLFVMVIIIDISNAVINFNELQESLRLKGEKIGVQVTTQQENIFRYIHRV
tara:strand:- start:322 stop:603 length:282 start_codon:yes stop_codon:yes gene_type:complete